MSDLISRKDVLKIIDNNRRDSLGIEIAVEKLPTVEARPVVHGEWRNAYPDIEPNPMFMYGICSNCGYEQSISNKLNFCPECGADMRGGKNE